MSWDGSAARQTGALAWRSVVTTVRLPQAWVPALFFPLVLMAIFTASFGGAPGNIPGFPPVRSFLDFAVSGAIVQGVLIGGTTAGAAFATDIEGGFFDRLVASPVSRTAILTGRLGASVVLGIAQALLFVGIAELFGADVAGGPGGFMVLLLITALFAVAVGGLGVFLALRFGSAEAVQGMFPLFFALLFFSSAFFPRETMTGWFRTAADWNPISHLVEAMRDEVVGGAEPGTVIAGVAIALTLAVLAVGASALAFRRRLREAP
ncbi:MAG: ABC transporter permease [Thermoleophilia bacterium]|nr:ABC transporter permease [Thermoleophilia bacterium]